MPTTVKKTSTRKVAPKVVTPEVTEPVAEIAEASDSNVTKIETVKVVRRKELVERIAASSGVKPNLIKSVLDAVLKEIGDVMSSGEVLQVQPLGKMSVNRRKDLPDGEVLICKLRRKNPVEKPAVEAAE